jgi:hypothetical protein
MKNTFYKMLPVAAVALCCVIMASGCKKDDNSNDTSTAQVYFTSNVINRDLLLTYAKDNTTDVTAKFNGFNFRLTDTASLAGTITVWNDLLSVKGTWTIDAGYDKISFAVPVNIIPDLALLNKEWQFTSRESAIIKVTATNGEADELNFSNK